MTEVLAAAVPGIPETVREAVLSRAARLSRAGRTVLDACAVVGSPVDPRLLHDVVDATPDAVDECLASGMIYASEQSLVFRHELARKAILEALSPTRRLDLHRRVLSALRLTPSPDAARLAHHAEASGEAAAVVTYATLAAEQAAAAGAHKEAVTQYERALRFSGGMSDERRGALLTSYAFECTLTDRVAEGIAAGQEAVGIWNVRGDRLKEGDGLRRLSRLFWLAGRREDAELAAWKALALLDSLPPGPQLAMTFSAISQLYLLSWSAEDAIAWGEKAATLAERLGEREILVHALNNVGMARLSLGDWNGKEPLERSLHIGLTSNLEEQVARAYSNLGVSHVVDYLFEDADRYLRDGIAYCTERDLDQQRLYMLAWHALSLFHQGRWPEAVAAASAVIGWPRVSLTNHIMALLAYGRVLVRQGDARAEAVLAEALDLATQTDELQRVGPVRVARAEFAWLAGDTSRVVAETQDTLATVLRLHHRWLAGELAFWLWRAGALAVAPSIALSPFAAQIAGDWVDAAARWQTLGCPYEAAWALADSGAEPLLREALAEFARLGASPAVAIVTRRLHELGAVRIPRGPRRTTRANPGFLTAREMDILALLADGLTNREIAERIFRSPRTVAHHVSAILAKLGVRSRQDAATAAVHQGIIGPK